MNFFWKIRSKFNKPKYVNIPMVNRDGLVVETPVPAHDDYVYQKLLKARKITQETGMPVHGWVSVVKRTWHSDPNGKEVAPITKEAGYYTEEIVDEMVPNLLTNGGRDYLIDLDYINANNTSGSNPANNVGLTTDSAAPSATDTSLASEITNADLARVQFGTRNHTTGTNAWSLVQTFTAANVYTNIQKAGLFNVSTAPVSGTMVHENTFTAVSLQINDQLQLTWSGTLG